MATRHEKNRRRAKIVRAQQRRLAAGAAANERRSAAVLDDVDVDVDVMAGVTAMPAPPVVGGEAVGAEWVARARGRK